MPFFLKSKQISVLPSTNVRCHLTSVFNLFQAIMVIKKISIKALVVAQSKTWQNRAEDEGFYLLQPWLYHIRCSPSVQSIRSCLLLLLLLENSLGAVDSLWAAQKKGPTPPPPTNPTTNPVLPKPPAEPPEGRCFDSGHYPHWPDPLS